jgi:hypothetical protein
MLICACEKKYITSRNAVISRENISCDGFISMPNVWRSVGIIDGSRKIKFFVVVVAL